MVCGLALGPIPDRILRLHAESSMDAIETVNCQNLIGGRWIPAESERTSENRCPAELAESLDDVYEGS